MKIVEVIPFIGAESSGPAYYIKNMCASLQTAGGEVELHTLNPLPREEFNFRIFGYTRHRFPVFALGRSPEMKRALQKTIADADIVHNNGLWMMPNIYPGLLARRRQRILVTSPHGTLAPFALGRSRWKKQLVAWLGQNEALAMTALFHATCEKEYREIRAAGFRQPVAIIPIGMDFIDAVPAKDERRKFVFFGRIHPVKAVDRLLQAWSMVANSFPQWDFIIAGPESDFSAKLQEITEKEKIPRVFFPGEINGNAKYELLANADCYALTSHTENFGVTVAEALASGTPVLVSSTIPWHEVTEHDCGWVSPNEPQALANAMREIFAIPRPKLEAMGQNGKQWIRRDFAWRNIGEKMLMTYQWLLGKGVKPEWIVAE